MLHQYIQFKRSLMGTSSYEPILPPTTKFFNTSENATDLEPNYNEMCPDRIETDIIFRQDKITKQTNKSFSIAAILGLQQQNSENFLYSNNQENNDCNSLLSSDSLSTDLSEVINLSIQASNANLTNRSSDTFDNFGVACDNHPSSSSSALQSRLGPSSITSPNFYRNSEGLMPVSSSNPGLVPSAEVRKSFSQHFQQHQHNQVETISSSKLPVREKNVNKMPSIGYKHITTTSINSFKKLSKCKRVRTIFTPEQLERLEAEFERQQYMVGPERLYLAHTLQLSEAQVKVWFQNRRIKWRKHHLELTHQRLAAIKQQHQIQQQLMEPLEANVESSASETDET